MKKVFNTEQEWKDARKGIITSTMASAILGLNPYMTDIEAWEQLVGLVEPEDISNKECVVKGKKAEKLIRDLWALDHPEYQVEEKENNLTFWISDKYNFIGASGDGDVKKGDKNGILEIKTTEVLSSQQREKWSFKEDNVVVPINYYIQVLVEMYCGDKDFAVLIPELKYSDDYTARRTILFKREDVQEDIDYIISSIVEFYNKYVLTKKKPPLRVSFK